jgi:putative FmdB family regulatory protein
VSSPEPAASWEAWPEEGSFEPGRWGMPTYVFRCRACGEQFEKVMSISEREKQKSPSCPKCKKANVERVYTAFYAKTSRKS